MSQVRIEGGRIEGAFHNIFRGAPETRTAAADIVLTEKSPMIQFIDPGGAARNVDLPAEAVSKGLVFLISNQADAAEVLTIRDDSATTIATPTQAEAAILFCNGVTWSGLVGPAS